MPVHIRILESPGNHIGLHWAKAQEMGKPLEIAIACVVDPVIQLAGATSLPFGLDEMNFAGGLKGEAIDVVPCETIDIEVPARSEFIIEVNFFQIETSPLAHILIQLVTMMMSNYSL